MNQTINLKTLLLIAALLGSIAAGIAWRNKRAAVIDSTMEASHSEVRGAAETRQLQWSRAIPNAKTK